jgi:hypothetical protein
MSHVHRMISREQESLQITLSFYLSSPPPDLIWVILARSDVKTDPSTLFEGVPPKTYW